MRPPSSRSRVRCIALAGGRLLENSGGEVEEWRTGKHSIGTYNLDVRPRVGTTYHDYRDIPLDDSFQKNIAFEGNKTAFVEVKISRKESVIYDIPYDFFIMDDFTASSEEPFVESGIMASVLNDFSDWPSFIMASASRFAVPEILLLSIAVMETTHGWYDTLHDLAGVNKSLRPMNINTEYWPELWTTEEMQDISKNIDAAAFLLKRIMERLSPNDMTVRKVATLYNSINATSVTDYGARVGYFVKTLRPDWLNIPPSSSVPSP